MIKHISIKNFKCLKNNEIDCKNLNILTGINGMGKSSIIQLLLILRQSYLDGAFNSDEKYISLGQHRSNDYFTLGTYEDAIYRDFEREEDYIRISIHFSNTEIIWQTESYNKIGGNNSEIPVEISDINKSFSTESLFAKKKFQFIQAERIGPREKLPVNDRMTANKDFGSDGMYAMQYFMDNKNKKISIIDNAHPKETSLLLEAQVNAWLFEISPNIQVQSESRLMEIVPKFGYSTKKPFEAKNVGFGVSYVFSVVLSLLTAEEGDLVIIENPEAHLHPQGQSKLAQLAAIAAKNGVQIFIETHSDHVINGVRLGVKIHKLPCEEVKIYYFTRQENEFTASIFDIPINQGGRLNIKELREKDIYGFFDQFDKDISTILGI